MPFNQFNLPPSAFSKLAPNVRDVFFDKGALLVDREGTAYRAGEVRHSVDPDDDPEQIFGVAKPNGMFGTRKTFSLREIQEFDLRVVWYPPEEGEF